MKITPFAVEIWMNDWETRCALNLAETCVASITIDELLSLSGRNSDHLQALLDLKMTYGEIRGSERLLNAISGLYRTMTPDNLITAHGTIGANALVYKALVDPGDRVITVVPTYQQHVSLPEALGAEVHRLQLRQEDRFLPDLDRLRALARGGAKLIVLNSPNNPTGAVVDEPMLREIAEIAREVGAYVLCDEVYRGLDQTGTGLTASIADVYEKGISTASLSKAFSMAGVRLGWVAGPSEVIEAVSIHRDYDTISVGRIDDHFAALALESKDRILERSRAITRGNLVTLADWVAREPALSWVRPTGGTTTLLKYDLEIPSHPLCVQLIKDTGVMFTPGSAFDMEGYVRIGFANASDVLSRGLPLVSEWLAAQR